MVSKLYTDGVKAVVFDWAGTITDYGCFAPLHVLIEVFKKRQIDITVEEARAPMGMLKNDHIRALCHMERIQALWEEKYGKLPDEKDAVSLYNEFEPMLLEALPKHSELIPGVLEVVNKLREKGIKIGSTTGYSSKMMVIVAQEAEKRGYKPDCIATPDEVPQGRPYPWMCYQNAIKLGVYPTETMVKVGDTVVDVYEGINAGMWSVGVIRGSSELGLTRIEVESLDSQTQRKKRIEVYERFKGAGAHYVIREISNLVNVIEDINKRLRKGEMPNGRKCKFS